MWGWRNSKTDLRAETRRACSAPDLERGNQRAQVKIGHWRSGFPINEEELEQLKDLEVESTDGWLELATGSGIEGSSEFQLLCRQGNSGGLNTTELRAFLTLPISATLAFDILYECDFLGMCFPSLGLEVSVIAESNNNDVVCIDGDKLNCLRWRRLNWSADGNATWLMRPAGPEALKEHPRQAALQATRKYNRSTRRNSWEQSMLPLSDAVCGFGLRPIAVSGSPGCRLFIYACLPGGGFVLRAALSRLCPGPLKRLASNVCGAAKQLEENTAPAPLSTTEQKAAAAFLVDATYSATETALVTQDAVGPAVQDRHAQQTFLECTSGCTNCGFHECMCNEKTAIHSGEDPTCQAGQGDTFLQAEGQPLLDQVCCNLPEEPPNTERNLIKHQALVEVPLPVARPRLRPIGWKGRSRTIRNASAVAPGGLCCGQPIAQLRRPRRPPWLMKASLPDVLVAYGSSPSTCAESLSRARVDKILGTPSIQMSTAETALENSSSNEGGASLSEASSYSMSNMYHELAPEEPDVM